VHLRTCEKFDILTSRITLFRKEMHITYRIINFGPSIPTIIKPKSDLRLLQIVPADEGEELRCTIQTYHRLHSSVEMQKCRALSYTWGDPEATIRITLNGKRFFVTHNLESALRRLRRKRGTVILPL
jgi:hypothetical protein